VQPRTTRRLHGADAGDGGAAHPSLTALTALALIAYAALTLNGVSVLPFLH
jgi:hypothetical protein